MSRHSATGASCCFVSALGVLLAIAFASPPVMILAFFAFLLACWVTMPSTAPPVEEPGPRYLVIRETQHVELQREIARRGWQ